MLCLVTQLYPSLYNPMNCIPSSSYVHGDSPGKNTGAGCHFLLQCMYACEVTSVVSDSV